MPALVSDAEAACPWTFEDSCLVTLSRVILDLGPAPANAPEGHVGEELLREAAALDAIARSATPRASGGCVRLVTKLTAHTLSVHLNRLLDHPAVLHIRP